MVADVLEPEQVRMAVGGNGWAVWDVFFPETKIWGSEYLLRLGENYNMQTWKQITFLKQNMYALKSQLSVFWGCILVFFGGGYVIEASLEYFPVIGNWKDAMKLDVLKSSPTFLKEFVSLG